MWYVMKILKGLKVFLFGQQTYLGSHVLYTSGYKNTIERLLISYSETKDRLSSTEVLNVGFWSDLFDEISFELMHFKAKEIMCEYSHKSFSAENIALFFEKHMNFNEEYVLNTLNRIQGSLEAKDKNKPHFSQKNYLAVHCGAYERNTLNKILVMLQICVNHIEGKKFSTRYLVDSSPLYLSDNEDLPAIGSPFNISLLMGGDHNTYGFSLGVYHCSAIRAFLKNHYESDSEFAYA